MSKTMLRSCLAWFFLFLACSDNSLPAADSKSAAPEIAPYVSFLETQKVDSVTYILNLFDTHDMVILCERDHREMTQYEFLFRLVSHPRFVQSVGHIFTEVGSQAQEKNIESFLTTPGLSPKETEQRLLTIYQDLSWMVFWEKTNFFDFLRQIQRFNSVASSSQKIHVHPCDLIFDWSKATPETYAAFRKGPLLQRDRLMADHVLQGFRGLGKTDPRRRKALVIMNYRHAFNDRFGFEGRKEENTGRFLFEALPGKVANVLISTLGLQENANDHVVSQKVLQDGKWDAAFAVAGDPEKGFPFAGNPFGKDSFDLYPFFPHQFTYQDVFTGMVFVTPLEKYRISYGIPGISSPAFIKEVQKRFKVTGEDLSDEQVGQMVKNLDTLQQKKVADLPRHVSEIRKWLK